MCSRIQCSTVAKSPLPAHPSSRAELNQIQRSKLSSYFVSKIKTVGGVKGQQPWSNVSSVNYAEHWLLLHARPKEKCHTRGHQFVLFSTNCRMHDGRVVLAALPIEEQCVKSDSHAVPTSLFYAHRHSDGQCITWKSSIVQI